MGRRYQLVADASQEQEDGAVCYAIQLVEVGHRILSPAERGTAERLVAVARIREELGLTR